MHTYLPYIAGEWLDTRDYRELARAYDGASLGRLAVAGSAEMETAIEAARMSFAATKRLTSDQRHAILVQIQNGIAARRDQFARCISDESGKTLRDAYTEVDRAILIFSLGADEARKQTGEFLPLDLNPVSAGRYGITRRFPIGPVGAISPFNFPLHLAAHKVAPAIAVGNPIVLKPAEKTPLTALLLAEVIHETPWPKGAFSVVTAKHAELGEALATDPRIAMLSFTGAAGVGWRLKSLSGRKKVVLELGGNAAVVVHSDTDLNHAIGRCVVGAFGSAGQVCISVQRIAVHRPIWDEFVERFTASVEGLRSGDPLDDATTLVSMISEDAAVRAEARITDAIDGGAAPLLLGKRRGKLLTPTILTGTRPDMAVCADEMFAPVVVVEPYDDFGEALRFVNEGDYGLQAGIFTRDVNRLFEAFAVLDVGGVVANDIPTYRADNMPYGGVKGSGFGREGVRYAAEDMTELRVMVLNLPIPGGSTS